VNKSDLYSKVDWMECVPERAEWVRSLRPDDWVAETDERSHVPGKSIILEVLNAPPVDAQNVPVPGFENRPAPFLLLSSRGYYDATGRMVPCPGLETVHSYWSIQPLSLRMCQSLERRELLGTLRELDMGLLSTEALRDILRVAREDQGVAL
jgi:hypothetical protein